jgi:hypothetical protein
MSKIMNKERILKNIKVHNSDITDEYLNYVITVFPQFPMEKLEKFILQK